CLRRPRSGRAGRCRVARRRPTFRRRRPRPRRRRAREPRVLRSSLRVTSCAFSFPKDARIHRHVSTDAVSSRQAVRKRSVRRVWVTDADAIRGRTLVEESREAVVVLGDDDRILLASRRARQSIDGLIEGAPCQADLLTGERGVIPLVVPYEVGGRRERLVYLSREGDLAAYEELRAGFTAAVSHELRTPLARLLPLLETTTLPGEDVPALVDQARGEIDQITELIDEVLFLSELESGPRVVALGPTTVKPVLGEALEELR